MPENLGFWRHLFAFLGPGYVIAVGYMDPGNWATDIQAGSFYNYQLLSVVLFANLVAVFLQALSAKLGIVTGRDLAQACHESYPKPVGVLLWISAEIGIVACDIAEVIGAAIALNLMFHIPMVVGVVVTALDVLLILALQKRGFRLIEALIISLIALMGAIFVFEIILSQPSLSGILHGFIPQRAIIQNPDKLYLGLGILGATVMPHNLYLHSSIVQTRQHERSETNLKRAVHAAQIDSFVALTLALFVNAAILIVAAAAFYHRGHQDVGEIKSAYKLLTPLLGSVLAAPLFAIALLADGQNATLTGTLAGQVILEGFTTFKIQPWVRRMISRSLAIIPAVIVVSLYGENGSEGLLIFSQVVLSIQLPFAMIPLIAFTNDKKRMKEFVNAGWLRLTGWIVAILITGLNLYLIYAAIFPSHK